MRVVQNVWCIRQTKKRETRNNYGKGWYTTGYLYQKDVTVSKKIILTTNTATADPVTTNAITEADAEDSSMVEPDSGEQE